MRSQETIATLLRSTLTVTPQTKASEVASAFQADEALRIIAVLENGAPVGAVHRNSFMAIFLSQFGHDLYGRRPIRKLMTVDPMTVEAETPLDAASRAITHDALKRAEHDFLIVREGKYLGVGYLIDLLQKITELQIAYARYANPLTLLPGNVPICEEIDSRLLGGEGFVVCYCDLDNFKPFNDAYGYDKGDDAIRITAELLTSYVDPQQDFVGHVGGDDFILLMRSSDWKTRVQKALNAFDERIVQLYSPEDRARKGIVAVDRRGQSSFFGILSLSVGAVQPTVELCQSHHEVASLAVHAKKMAKQTPGSVLFVDRRHTP
ncbi:putative diguanylate cyclase [Magnetofaba australis IT-1]|uniref:diguanylate cyclase n=1 Tax=Magnetofaba australis IT-1 TaxID=1434232 RepID=A0A1Y2K390_9PROT|nr:putative diguanylate cyclase [Magnetofaba australis IT-1]